MSTPSSQSLPAPLPKTALHIPSPVIVASTSSSSVPPLSLLRKYYASLGYRVHSGLQFGTSLVLYADDPSKVRKRVEPW